MRENPVVREALGRFKENELFLASKFYRQELSDKIGEAAYYKTLERMCKSGELMKIAKGTYHLPKASKYGIVPPSEKEIISAFTKNETGTVIGYSLYNSLNLTTQISKSVNIMSSALEGFSKTIRNITVQRASLVYSENVQNMIHGLEVLQNFSMIQDINYAAFISYTEKLAGLYNENSIKEILAACKYKKSTIAFLQEILKHYRVENNLEMYLSSLSEYKYPRMEELYEASRIS